jgi:hypothetical protein
MCDRRKKAVSFETHFKESLANDKKPEIHTSKLAKSSCQPLVFISKKFALGKRVPTSLPYGLMNA